MKSSDNNNNNSHHDNEENNSNNDCNNNIRKRCGVFLYFRHVLFLNSDHFLDIRHQPDLEGYFLLHCEFKIKRKKKIKGQTLNAPQCVKAHIG